MLSKLHLNYISKNLRIVINTVKTSKSAYFNYTWKRILMEYLVKSVIKGTHRVVWVYELYFSNEKIQVPGNMLNQIIKNFLRCNNWLTGISLAQCHQVDWSFHKGTTNLWKLFSAWKNYEAPQLIIFLPICEIYCELFTQGLGERKASRGCSQPPSAACLHRIRAK